MNDLRSSSARQTSAGCSSSPVVRGGGSPVMEIELCRDRLFVSTSASDEKTIVGPVLEQVGPQIEDIVIHARGRSFTTNFDYQIELEWSYDGEIWASYILLSYAESTANPVIGSVKNDRSKFGRLIRFVIKVKGAASETNQGSLSATAAVRLFS